ncbi:MAG: DUF192 domain-containing protein, partial [Pseudomonadota bacterium]
MAWRFKSIETTSSALKQRLVFFLLILFVAFSIDGEGASQDKPKKPKDIVFEKAKLQLENHVLEVEMALNDEQRQRGLMFRKKLAEGKGMLFVFSQQRTLSFWMKNTLIPLSIGYFDQDKKLVDVKKMNPESSMVRDSELKR